MIALRHMTHTWTSSFLQTSREFFRVRRLGNVLERVTRVELKENQISLETRSSAEIFLDSYISYLMECRAVRGADDDGEGRLQSPWRSSIDRLQGESIDDTSAPDSDCSPSNLMTNKQE